MTASFSPRNSWEDSGNLRCWGGACVPFASGSPLYWCWFQKRAFKSLLLEPYAYLWFFSCCWRLRLVTLLQRRKFSFDKCHFRSGCAGKLSTMWNIWIKVDCFRSLLTHQHQPPVWWLFRRWVDELSVLWFFITRRKTVYAGICRSMLTCFRGLWCARRYNLLKIHCVLTALLLLLEACISCQSLATYKDSLTWRSDGL
jgi:hypothetical protein